MDAISSEAESGLQDRLRVEFTREFVWRPPAELEHPLRRGARFAVQGSVFGGDQLPSALALSKQF